MPSRFRSIAAEMECRAGGQVAVSAAVAGGARELPAPFHPSLRPENAWLPIADSAQVWFPGFRIFSPTSSEWEWGRVGIFGKNLGSGGAAGKCFTIFRKFS